MSCFRLVRHHRGLFLPPEELMDALSLEQRGAPVPVPQRGRCGGERLLLGGHSRTAAVTEREINGSIWCLFACSRGREGWAAGCLES